MMACQIRKMALFTLLLLCALPASAQVSGVPGDGIPDLYYFPNDGQRLTSFGLISRPAGTMALDSDGFDINAVLIGGANVTQPPSCDLCEGFALPQDGNLPLPGNRGLYTLGYSGTAPNGSSQWIRSNNPPPPAPQKGFVGVIGTGYVKADNTVVNGWPESIPGLLDFPTLGLANYGPGLTDAAFPKVFNDGNSEALWNVRVASGNTGASRFTNVTVVPEPTSGLLSVLGLAALSFIRRR